MVDTSRFLSQKCTGEHPYLGACQETCAVRDWVVNTGQLAQAPFQQKGQPYKIASALFSKFV